MTNIKIAFIMENKKTVNSQGAVLKLSKILRVAGIDIECVHCKEVYPDFINSLISRIQTSIEHSQLLKTTIKKSKSQRLTYFTKGSKENRGYQDTNGQLFGVSWENIKLMNEGSDDKKLVKDLADCSYKNTIDGNRNESKDNRGRVVHTPQTKRYQYSMTKANEIDLAVDKKIQIISDRKEKMKSPLAEQGKKVRINELSHGGKFVFGRSGSKWDKGEKFPEIWTNDIYEGSEGI